MLLVQAVLALVALHQIARRVLPAAPASADTEAVIDAWAPLALVLPMVLMVGQVEWTVRGVGWIAVGGPIVCGYLGLGLVAWRGPISAADAPDRLTPRMLLMWTATGVLLLLLGWRQDLSLWVGQSVFAIAAVLLWTNVPTHASAGPPGAAGAALLLAMLCAAGQGVAALVAGPAMAPACAALMILYAGAGLLAIARAMGSRATLRVAGWAATFGVLLGVGGLSLLKLFGVLAAAVWTGHPETGLPAGAAISYGFGAYALEATALALLGAAAIAAERLARRGRALLAATAIAAAILLAGWRLAGLIRPSESADAGEEMTMLTEPPPLAAAAGARARE